MASSCWGPTSSIPEATASPHIRPVSSLDDCLWWSFGRPPYPRCPALRKALPQFPPWNSSAPGKDRKDQRGIPAYPKKWTGELGKMAMIQWNWEVPVFTQTHTNPYGNETESDAYCKLETSMKHP